MIEKCHEKIAFSYRNEALVSTPAFLPWKDLYHEPMEKALQNYYLQLEGATNCNKHIQSDFSVDGSAHGVIEYVSLTCITLNSFA